MGKILFILKEVAVVVCGAALTAASAAGVVLFAKHKLNNADSSLVNASDNIKFDDLVRNEPALANFGGKEFLCVDIFEEKEDEESCFYIQLVKDYPTGLGGFYKDKECEIRTCDESEYDKIVKKFDGGVFKVRPGKKGKIELEKQEGYGATLRDMHGDSCKRRFVERKLREALQQIQIAKQ